MLSFYMYKSCQNRAFLFKNNERREYIFYIPYEVRLGGSRQAAYFVRDWKFYIHFIH